MGVNGACKFGIESVPERGSALASDIPSLPPMREWVNVRTLGAKGDGGR